ncbi:MAG: hypothetical protein ACOC2D_21280, partial [Spirochaetota bacterium]
MNRACRPTILRILTATLATLVLTAACATVEPTTGETTSRPTDVATASAPAAAEEVETDRARPQTAFERLDAPARSLAPDTREPASLAEPEIYLDDSIARREPGRSDPMPSRSGERQPRLAEPRVAGGLDAPASPDRSARATALPDADAAQPAGATAAERATRSDAAAPAGGEAEPTGEVRRTNGAATGDSGSEARARDDAGSVGD